MANRANDTSLAPTIVQAAAAMMVAIIGAVGGYFVAVAKAPAPTSPSIVPARATTRVNEFAHGDDEAFVLLRDQSVWDLRGWKDTPPDKQGSRFSPANYLNYLHVKKTRPTQKYAAHFETSGYAIDLRCITHDAKVYERLAGHDRQHATGKEYQVEVDVSSVPVDQEFLIVIEATYWNGFQGEHQDASTYTDADTGDLGELGLIVLFPDSRPFKPSTVNLFNGPSPEQLRPFRGDSSFYKDLDGRFLYWDIRPRLPNQHYTVKWDW
ncbi:MAG TPA: hypothetical protein VLJ39_21945 [Tepidisphaeraceae bacterium]|nr:hypothetical protein [Tepidisphaeraceae bacterium]